MLHQFVAKIDGRVTCSRITLDNDQSADYQFRNLGGQTTNESRVIAIQHLFRMKRQIRSVRNLDSSSRAGRKATSS